MSTPSEKKLKPSPAHRRGSLTPQQIQEFHSKGWIVLSSLFNREEVSQFVACFERLAQTAAQLKTTQTHNKAHFVLSEKENKTIINRICWAGGAEQELLNCSSDPRLTLPVSQLLESNEFDQLLCQAHFKLPGDGVSFDWHQDVQHRDKGKGSWKDVNGKGSYVQSILLLDDMTNENGPVQFIPESSQWGRVFSSHFEYDIPLGQKQSADSIDYSKAETLTGKAGDVILFGPYTIHGSGPNLSTSPRRLLINGYASAGANNRVYPGEGSGRRLTLDETL